MQVSVKSQNIGDKELVFNQNFWTGKIKIYYDNTELKKISNKVFQYQSKDKIEQLTVKGNQLTGISINFMGQDFQIMHKLSWYEIVLSLFVFLPCILFGAIGGALGGLFGAINLIYIRYIEKIWLKIVISLEICCIALLLSYIFACMVFKLFTFI